MCLFMHKALWKLNLACIIVLSHCSGHVRQNVVSASTERHELGISSTIALATGQYYCESLLLVVHLRHS
jgi:hypothetical protein